MTDKKIFKDFSEFQEQLKEIKDGNSKVVFTNGCFDLIHLGHLDYLKETSKYGEVLVVGLNSDSSVTRLKGDKRPLFNFKRRAKFLSYLDFVDFIVGFSEDTPYSLIERIRPDTLVKGGDYEFKEIVGHKILNSYGGQVLTIPFKYEESTSDIIEKIRKRYK